MTVIKPCRLLLLCSQLTFLSYLSQAQTTTVVTHAIEPVSFQNVRIDDQFWNPKFKVWNSTTVYDVFDKLEGKYEPDRPDIIKEKEKLGRTRNAFQNFDWVAEGKKNTQQHDGPPWYDGLVYETIRGAADLLTQHPDKNWKLKLTPISTVLPLLKMPILMVTSIPIPPS